MQVCVYERKREREGRRENEKEKESETDDTRVLFNLHPSLNNNSTLEDGSFDPLTHRCSSHAEAYVAKTGLYRSL